jgi:NAD-dependent SIR2 family protein deacetylase
MENEIPTVEVNPSSTPITTRVTYALTGPAGEILPALVEALKKLDGEINDHPHHI